MLKTIFLGTPQFSLPSLEAAYKHSELIAVVSQPDAPKGRKQLLQPSEVKSWAMEKAIPCFTPKSLKNENDINVQGLIDLVKDEKIDLFIVTAFGQILSESFLNLAKFGAINIHASLLPYWRGAAPMQRSLEAGDKITGICLQKMVKKLDAGNILDQRVYEIQPSDDAVSMSEHLSKMSSELLSAFLINLEKDNSILSGKTQDESLVTYAKKIEKKEGFWNPTWTAAESINRVRAFAQWPHVRAKLRAEGIRAPEFIRLAKLASAQNQVRSSEKLVPGKLFLENKKVFLGCSDNFVEIVELQVPGKSIVPAFNYFQNIIKEPRQNGIFLASLENK